MRITFVRHGESEANRAERWQGQSNSPLSARGRAQALRLAKRFRDQAFTRVISSDLDRAAETARALGRELSFDPIWRELDVGRWEGLTRQEVHARFPEDLASLARGEDVPLGGGESYASFGRRVDGALAALRASLGPDDHALVVCHGGVIGSVIAGALGVRGTRRWPFSRAYNTSISELAFDGDHAELAVWNDAAHLPAEDRTFLGDEPGIRVVLVARAKSSPKALGSYLRGMQRVYANEGVEALLPELETERLEPKLGRMLEDAERVAAKAPPHSDDAAEALSAALVALGARHEDGPFALVVDPALVCSWTHAHVWHGDSARARVGRMHEARVCELRLLSTGVRLVAYNVGPVTHE